MHIFTWPFRCARSPATALRCGFIAASLVWPGSAVADWPQFLGPTRNGVYSGPPSTRPWPKEGPPVLWKKKVGQGFSAPITVGGRLFLFHRLGGEEIMTCLEAASGKPVWKQASAAVYRDDFGFDEGPRATPCAVSNRVVSLGAAGVLQCRAIADGGLLWSLDTQKELKAAKGFFGMACSPLVVRDTVVVNVGGEEGAGIVGIGLTSGRIKWKATDHEAGYASPVKATISGREVVHCFTRAGLVSLEPESGKVVAEFPWRSRTHASVNAATPIVDGSLVFLSSSYGAGAVVVDTSQIPPKKLWSADGVLSNHYATSVLRDGFLFGFDGRQEHGTVLRCVELRTGKVQWSHEGLGAGTLLIAGDQLLILSEKGELIEGTARPSGFTVTQQAQILGAGVRAHAALDNGVFFARSPDTLVAVNLRAE